MTTSRSDPAILVVGGRGFVGAHVTAALIASGRRPHLFGPAMQDDLLAEFAGRFDETRGSVTDRAALQDALAQSGAREVVSMAAHSAGRAGLMKSGEAEADRALEVNFGGLRTLAAAALEAGVRRLVWASSTTVYGAATDYPGGPVDEDAPAAPRTFYGLTKQLAEATGSYFARRHGLPVTALRLPLVLGPKLWYSGAAAAILDAAGAAARGRRHEVQFHDEAMDLMHVHDAARAVMACLDHDGALSDRYNILGFRARMSDILAGLRQRRPGWEVRHDIVPAAQDFPPVDDSRFRRDLGFAPELDLSAVLEALLAEETSR